MKVINSDFCRITYVVGGSKGTKWSRDMHVSKNGEAWFTSIESGMKKYLNSQCEFVISEVDELPPDVRENAIQAGMIDPADAEPMGGTA